MQSEASIRAACELLDRLQQSRHEIAHAIGGPDGAINDHDASTYEAMRESLAWVLGEIDSDPDCENGLAAIIRRHSS